MHILMINATDGRISISSEVYHLICWTTALRMSTWLSFTSPLIFRIATWTHLSCLTRLSHPGRKKVQSNPMFTASKRAVQADCLHASHLFFLYGSPISEARLTDKAVPPFDRHKLKQQSYIINSFQFTRPDLQLASQLFGSQTINSFSTFKLHLGTWLLDVIEERSLASI